MEWTDFIHAFADRSPPAPADQLQALEAELGCALPADYRRFLIECNGGSCGGRLLYNEPLANGRPADIVLCRMYGLRSQRSFSLHHARDCYQSAGDLRIPLDVLPIADDCFGNTICIGQRGTPRGRIYFWDHENEPDPSTWDGWVETAGNLELIAASFSQFVAGLQVEPPLSPPPDFTLRLRDDWCRYCDDLGLGGDVNGVWEQLRACYSEPWRAYHNLRHIDECLNCCDCSDQVVSDRRAVAVALWFHDAVYRAGAADNETRSAALARECLTSLGASRELSEHVAALVLATDHRRPPSEVEAQLICDIDLRILGRGIDIYDAYAAAIQAEVGLPASEYAPHRQAFLENMLAREHIYHTADFRQQYEGPARHNLQRELDLWRRTPRA